MVQALKKLVFCLVAVFAVLGWPVRADEAAPSPDSDVKILTNANFDKLTSQGDWLIEFYAPWCGHCKQLKPVFEEAASTSLGKLNFGAVDCTSNRDLQEKFNIRSYPTIKFLRDGVARNYKGDRNVKAFETFAEHMSQPSVALVSSLKELKEASGKVPVTFLYVTPSSSSDDDHDDELFSIFSRVSRAMQSSDLLFAKGSANAIRNKYTSGKQARGSVVMLTEGDVVLYSGSPNENKLRDWVEQHKLPLVSSIQPGTFEDVTGSGRVVFFAVVNPRSLAQTKQFIESVRTVAKRHRQFVFAEIDGVKFNKYVSQFGVTEDSFPAMFALDYPAEIYWTVPADMMVTNERSVEEFVSEVASGKIQGRGISAWYNPMKWFKDFEKWLGSFNETQLMYGVGGAMIVFLGILIFACIYAGSDLMEPDQPSRSNKDLDNVPGAARRKNQSESKPKDKQEVKLVEEAEEEEPPSNVSASQLALRNKKGKGKSKKET